MHADSNKSIIDVIKDFLGVTLNSKLVYGDPFERDGLVIIPVAKVTYGFGGGRGHRLSSHTGEGGGVGVSAKPVGFIEIRNGHVEFKPIVETSALPLYMVSIGISTYLVLKGLSLLLKKSR